MAETAKKSPCLDCEHLWEDKTEENPTCYKCEKRIAYSLSLEDPRTIPDYFWKDREKEKELDKIDWARTPEQKPPSLSWQINRILYNLAKKEGFDDYIKWLKYLNIEKKISINKIAKIYGFSFSSIKIRLQWDKPKNIKPPEVDKKVKRYCLNCNKQLFRKTYEKYGKENINRFLNRKFCNKECHDEYQRNQLQDEKRYCEFCYKELTRKIYKRKDANSIDIEKLENRNEFLTRKYCNQFCFREHRKIKNKEKK